MIQREDFATEDQKFAPDLFQTIKITELASDFPIMKLLRKPDFLRETNYWSPEQIVEFIESVPSAFSGYRELPMQQSLHSIRSIRKGFRAIGMIAALEEDLGRPVLTGNQVAFWYALRRAGVRQPVKRIRPRVQDTELRS